MKVNRNAPCPCGSGKKYKHCCMQKDQESERERRAAERGRLSDAVPPPEHQPEPPEPPEPPSPVPEPDSHVEACNQLWDVFESQDYEAQIALFADTLDKEELMDEQMAFDMLNTLYYRSVERGERDRFDELANSLRRRLPDVYAYDAGYYLDWQITNAIASDRWTEIPRLAREMAATGDESIDVFFNILDQLAYHDQLSAIVESMRIAWPQLKHSSSILPPGIDEFAEDAVTYVIFDYLERCASPDAHSPELAEHIEFYLDFDPQRLARYIMILTGQTEQHWMLSDFEFKHLSHRSDDLFDENDEADRAPDPGAQNLYDLSVEFLGYLRREEGVPYTKGELARRQIERYILDRHTGELKPRPSPLETAVLPRKRKRKPKKQKQPKHVLCPDRSTLDRYLVRLLHFINPQFYKCAAAFEMIPAWLRFLESHQLVSAAQRQETLANLRGLDTELHKVWESYRADPILQEGTKRWRQNAGMETTESA